jgi:hypothetical protein
MVSHHFDASPALRNFFGLVCRTTVLQEASLLAQSPILPYKGAVHKVRVKMTYPSTLDSQRSFFGSATSLIFISSSTKSSTTTSGAVLGARMAASKLVSPVVGTRTLPLFLAIPRPCHCNKAQGNRSEYQMPENRKSECANKVENN